jgi:hypothetical protein
MKPVARLTHPLNVPTKPESVTSTAAWPLGVEVPDVTEIGVERNATWSRRVWGVMGSELAGDEGSRMMA